MTQKLRRRARDIRTLTAGLGNIDFDYAELTNADWLFIQQKLKAKIPLKLRGQLSGLTMIYLMGSHTPHRELSITQAKREINLWADRTRALRRLVWSTGQRPALRFINLEEILAGHFGPRRGFHAGIFPLAHLAQFLDGAEALAKYFVANLENTKAATNKATELWLIWSALVIALCRKNNIPVEQKSKKAFFPGFLILLDRLQATLKASKISIPTDIVNSTPSKKAFPKPSIKKDDSLRRSAWQAFKIAEGNPVDDLAAQLVFRSTGWLQFGEGNTEVERRMTFLQKRLQVEATIRKRPARTA